MGEGCNIFKTSFMGELVRFPTSELGRVFRRRERVFVRGMGRGGVRSSVLDEASYGCTVMALAVELVGSECGSEKVVLSVRKVERLLISARVGDVGEENVGEGTRS